MYFSAVRRNYCRPLPKSDGSLRSRGRRCGLLQRHVVSLLYSSQRPVFIPATSVFIPAPPVFIPAPWIHPSALYSLTSVVKLIAHFSFPLLVNLLHSWDTTFPPTLKFNPPPYGPSFLNPPPLIAEYPTYASPPPLSLRHTSPTLPPLIFLFLRPWLSRLLTLSKSVFLPLIFCSFFPFPLAFDEICFPVWISFCYNSRLQRIKYLAFDTLFFPLACIIVIIEASGSFFGI